MQENDHHNPTVSQYFSKIQVNEQSKPFLNKKHDQKTPEKGILKNAQCNSPPSGLLSPDDLMLPTPPQPKRLKMDETDKSFARNLKHYNIHIGDDLTWCTSREICLLTGTRWASTSFVEICSSFIFQWRRGWRNWSRNVHQCEPLGANQKLL